MVRQLEIVLPPFKKGIHLITHIVENGLGLNRETGILHVFLKHTSAGLCLNENADPSVRYDLNSYFNEIVPENNLNFTHTLEGSDDMPAHIKSVLVGSSLSLPISDGKLNLGVWQGIYLCEFRNHGGSRELILTIQF